MNPIFDRLEEYIIYENAHIIALNKPEGVLVIPDGYDKTQPCLQDLLTEKYGKIWVTHRLDKATSGVILFAKDSETHKFMNIAFSNRRVKKTYIAIIHGVPFWDKLTINYPLKVNGDRMHRTTISFSGGKKASTYIKILEKAQFSSKALIEPKSGYTHQIRSHLSNIGHPILGDSLYDRQRMRDPNQKIRCPATENGLFLHAFSLQFMGDDLNFPALKADLPVKFQNS